MTGEVRAKAPRGSSQPKQSLEDPNEPAVEWNPENEVNLFYALKEHKPVGVNRYFEMIFVHETFTRLSNQEVHSKQLWDHLDQLWDMDALHENAELPFPNDELDFVLPNDYLALVDRNTSKRKSQEEGFSASTPSSSASSSRSEAPSTRDSDHSKEGPTTVSAPASSSSAATSSKSTPALTPSGKGASVQKTPESGKNQPKTRGDSVESKKESGAKIETRSEPTAASSSKETKSEGQKEDKEVKSTVKKRQVPPRSTTETPTSLRSAHNQMGAKKRRL